MPLIGLFGAWNERLDGTGTEVKVSAAYGQKNATITRQVVGTSEAGSGEVMGVISGFINTKSIVEASFFDLLTMSTF